MVISASKAGNLRELARALLEEHGADLSSGDSTGKALGEILRAYHRRLSALVGDGGFLSLLELAGRQALPEHPALEPFLSSVSIEAILDPGGKGPASGSGEEGAAALSDFLGQLLSLLRGLGRDQDWAVVELWPGLRALEEAGLLDEPREGGG